MGERSELALGRGGGPRMGLGRTDPPRTHGVATSNDSLDRGRRDLPQPLSPIAAIGLAVTTIQLTPERRDQLARLKVAGLTYDDVLGFLLAKVDEERFRSAILAWEKDAVSAIRANTKNRRLA